MAKGDSVDLMIKFVKSGTKALEGECTTVLVKPGGESNNLIKGFDPGYFSEIDRFTMRAGIRDEDADEGKSGTQTTQQRSQATTTTTTTNGPHGTTTTTTTSNAQHQTATARQTSTRGSYQSWRNGTNKGRGFPVDLAPVSFTRVIDKTSKDLIQSCIDSESFEKITLIKRKSSGIQNISGEVGSGDVFLRVDFIGCLIIKVDWDNDDKVTETVDFICRTVSIRYRPQLPDGSLGATKTGFYTMVGDIQPPES